MTSGVPGYFGCVHDAYRGRTFYLVVERMKHSKNYTRRYLGTSWLGCARVRGRAKY